MPRGKGPGPRENLPELYCGKGRRFLFRRGKDHHWAEGQGASAEGCGLQGPKFAICRDFRAEFQGPVLLGAQGSRSGGPTCFLSLRLEQFRRVLDRGICHGAWFGTVGWVGSKNWRSKLKPSFFTPVPFEFTRYPNPPFPAPPWSFSRRRGE